MKNLTNTLITLGAAVACVSSALAGEEGWTSDFEAAKKQAAEENKSLLIDFTGSDWCGWCIRLQEEVFSKDEFKKGVAEDYVLVEIDFPQNEAKLSDETKAQNEKLGNDTPYRDTLRSYSPMQPGSHMRRPAIRKVARRPILHISTT